VTRGENDCSAVLENDGESVIVPERDVVVDTETTGDCDELDDTVTVTETECVAVMGAVSENVAVADARIEYDEVPDIEALVVIDTFPLTVDDKDAEEDTEEQPEDEALERTEREALGLPEPVSNGDNVTSGDRDVDEQGVAVIDRADVGDKLELPELD
jgi:hypothetical protein